MDKRQPDYYSPQKTEEQQQLSEEKKIRRFKLAKMQSYHKFDIKGIIRLQYLEEKRKEIMYSYNSSRLNREFKSKSKNKKMDMIIPSLQAFNINTAYLPGFNQYQTQKSVSRPKTQTRNRIMEFKRGRSMQDSVNLSQKDFEIQIKLPMPETKSKICWERKSTQIKKDSYDIIHNKNQNNTQRKFRSKNIENILRRKSTNFPQMINEYCRRMKISEQSKIFVFQSGDSWLKELLLQKGWVLNPDPNSKIFHLKWTSKISNEKADQNQLINHFYDSDCLTSKQGLAKMVKDSKILSRLSPRSFDLGSELNQFVVNFNQTQILCCLKKIVKQIESNNLAPSQLIDGKMLKEAFSSLRISEDYQQRQAQHNFFVHVPYAVQLCAFCENIRCSLEQQSRQPQNKLNEKSTKNLFNFSLLNPPYIQYQTSSSSSTTSPKIHFNPTDINLYSSSNSFTKPSQLLLQLLLSYHSYFLQNLHTYRAEGMNNIWIVKNRNSSKGMGIMLSYNLHQLVKKTQNKLVQKYLEDCVLYDGIGDRRRYKFDLRVWVLVTCFNPVICYFYQQFYCRLCSQPYSFNNLNNPQAHLTNYTQNKQSFSMHQKPSIISYPNFLTLLQKSQKKPLPLPLPQQTLTKKLHNLIYHTISSYKNTIKSHRECFELYGFDVLIAEPLEELDLYLLEVNLSPACLDREEWLSGSVRAMGRGMLDIVVGNQRVADGWIPVVQ